MSGAPTELSDSISDLPEALRAPVELWLTHFLEANAFNPGWSANKRATLDLLKLVACSEFAGAAIVRDWKWVERAALEGRLVQPPDTALRAEEFEDAGGDDVKRRLRRFRNRTLLHILWRDLAGAASVAETLSSLSELADSLIGAATHHAEVRFQGRFGKPLDKGGHPMRIVVLAMGKLGGGELNFSSDVDLLFLYPGDGETDGKRQLSAQEYFTRVARAIVGLLDEVTMDGFVYRVDTRLRPFGDSGPPVVSFGALESYLLRHGRDWERYAYVKARVIETNRDGVAAAELMQQVIHPFVYRRYLDYGVFESLREMKSLITEEAKKRRLRHNIKLGPGGIREIEFIVQSLQLVRGGSDRNLKTPSLRRALQQLRRAGAIKVVEANRLLGCYDFLRRLENAMQAIRDQQVHDLPGNPADQARLALALGFGSWAGLLSHLKQAQDEVASSFAEVAFRGAGAAPRSAGEDPVAVLLETAADAAEWQGALARLGYPDSTELAGTLASFSESGSVTRLSTAARSRMQRFVPALLAALKDRSQPAVVLKRVLAVVDHVIRRSAYVALLNENPLVLDRLVDLCETSAWLAEEIGRYPLLLDELLDPRLYTAPLTRENMLEELNRRLAGLSSGDSEQQIEILAQFRRAILFRIAVADVTGKLPIMKVSDRLTEVAEIVLSRTLSIAWQDLATRHGRPMVRGERGLRPVGFGVIAYGKFGGMELSYRSDLDLVFLHDGHGTEQNTDGPRPLENGMFFVRLVRRLVHLLTARTHSGAMYEVDTRLRPSGRSGLLVTSVEAFERYQEENAWTWEHQALLRARPVAGSATVAREFERVRAETLRERVRLDRLRADVKEMRLKMRSQLDKSDGERFDLKQGEGGIGDIEFLVQYLVLKHARTHPAVIHYPDNIRQLGTLAAAGCLDAEEVARLQDIYKRYRLRLHRLSLDERPPFAGGGEFVEERAFVESLWDRVMVAPDP